MLSLVMLWVKYKHIAMNEASSQIEKERVQVYVDGFNLYFGMLEAGFNNCNWLNLKKLSINLLKPHQELAGVKYFTSRVSNNPDKQKRQVTYLEALDARIFIRVATNENANKCAFSRHTKSQEFRSLAICRSISSFDRKPAGL